MGDRREDTVTVTQLTATKMETMRSKQHGRGPSNHKQRIWKGQHQIKEKVGEKMGQMQVFPVSQFFLYPQTLLHLSERCATNNILIIDILATTHILPLLAVTRLFVSQPADLNVFFFSLLFMRRFTRVLNQHPHYIYVHSKHVDSSLWQKTTKC